MRTEVLGKVVLGKKVGEGSSRRGFWVTGVQVRFRNVLLGFEERPGKRVGEKGLKRGPSGEEELGEMKPDSSDHTCLAIFKEEEKGKTERKSRKERKRKMEKGSRESK